MSKDKEYWSIVARVAERLRGITPEEQVEVLNGVFSNLGDSAVAHLVDGKVAVSEIDVKPSCGCVFCDLMLYPNGSGLHATEEGAVKCTRVK